MWILLVGIMLQGRSSDLSLKERIIRSPGTLSLPLALCGNRSDKLKQWSSKRMAKAIDAVQKEHLSLRRAAEEFDIPKSTLHDRLIGKVQLGAQSGPPKYLTDQEEEELESFLCGCASVGYARSRQQVMELVQEVINRKGVKVVLSHGWWESFKRRHPNLSLRVAAPLSYARMVGSDPVIIDKYFDLLQQTLADNELHDKPSQIFNLDETGMPLNPDPPRVVAPRGTKNPSAVGSGDKSQITVLSCCSAAGYALPPFVIFDRVHLRPEFAEGEVPGTVYGLSKKGWIDGALFESWFARHFLAHAPPVRPLLLLMDGHSSHFNPSVVERAAEEGVIMFTLPPHTFHLTQPLDKGCFGPLKVHWRNECWEYIITNPGRVVTRFQFSQLFRRAWMKGMTMVNIVARFRTTGIYPLDRSVVSTRSVAESNPSTLPERTGLKFIPLYSPSVRRPTARVSTFSAEEIARYEARWEEGYDVPDERYKEWLSIYHPDRISPNTSELYQGAVSVSVSDSTQNSDTPVSSTPNHTCRAPPPTSFLSHLLSERNPTVKYPQKAEKARSGSRVLTSAENLSLMREKEKRKKEVADEKQRRKEEREKKKAAAEAERARRMIERDKGRSYPGA